MRLTNPGNLCIVERLTCYPFLVMTLESDTSTPSGKEKASLHTLVEASCEPMFGKIKYLLDIDLTSQQIIDFAERNEIKAHAVSLAVHICDILLSGMRNEQNGDTYIHTTKDIRKKIRHLLKTHAEQSSELLNLHKRYDLPLVMRPNLVKLAQQFLEEL